MANRYYIEEGKDDGWKELDTRPLYSVTEARAFVANLKAAPVGDWANRRLRIVKSTGEPVG